MRTKVTEDTRWNVGKDLASNQGTADDLQAQKDTSQNAAVECQLYIHTAVVWHLRSS